MNPSADDIRDWIVARVASLTGLPADEVDPAAPLTRHGLDSVAAITLASDLEAWLGYRFRENPLDAHPTIDALARFLAEKMRG
jgi:acyl carrier protein